MNVPDTFPALFWAYSAIWALLIGYVFLLKKKISAIEKKINQEDDS